MSCTQRVSIRLNSLESIWYCILVVFVTIFLLGDAIRQYSHYKHLPWPEGPPLGELRLYGLLIFSAFALILLFIPTQIFKVGNRANDQDKLGMLKNRKDGLHKIEEGRQFKKIRQYIYKFRRVSKHMGPIGATLHMISAFCLLLPLMFLQARAIKYGLLPREMIWQSEVAVIAHSDSEFRLSLDPVITHEGYGVDPAMQVTKALMGQQDAQMIPSKDPFRVFMITINYLNYIVPLFFYAVRYAEVFWVCHKGFAFLFSAQLMLNATHYGLGFIGMSLLYKLSMFGWEKHNFEETPTFGTPSYMILTFLIQNITVFISAVDLYLYGYTHYKLSKVKKVESSSNRSQTSPCVLRCNGLIPHMVAFLVFVILLLCKGFFIAEYAKVYRYSKDGRILCCLLFDTLFLCCWTALWIFFTYKHKWNFGFFSHPIPYSGIVGNSEDETKAGSSSNSDLEMNNIGTIQNHSRNHGIHYSLSGETQGSGLSVENSANLAIRDSSSDERRSEENNRVNEKLSQSFGNIHSIAYADEESSQVVQDNSSTSTPVRKRDVRNNSNSQSKETKETPCSPGHRSSKEIKVVPAPEGHNGSYIMEDINLEDDLATITSPMLPIEA